jgi:1-deoxy-D-xylulose-5-phosphate synthase
MIDSQRYPRLARIDSPADLRQFDAAELPDVARELREYLIESVAGVRRTFRRRAWAWSN